MKKNFIYFLILITIIFIFYVFYKSLQKESIYVPDQNTNKKIVNFSSKELYTQKTIEFEQVILSNKFTILNIWSSWCLPCREEHKFLIELKNKNNFNMIGINYKDNLSNAKKFLNEIGNPYSTILIDKDGTLSIKLGAYGVPETFLISNTNRRIIKKYIGPLNKNNLDEILNLSK